MKNKILLTLCLFAFVRAQAALDVPAFTAYLEPAEGGADISQAAGITGWDDSAQKILWFGDIKTAGKLDCVVKLKLAAAAETKLRLTVAGKASEATVHGAGGATNVAFGTFEIPVAGYQSFTLESLNAAGKDAGGIESLVLDGPAAAAAHFNLKLRRNTASVHLAYPTKGVTNIDAFYCEVTPMITPLWTYFEACGWHRGYFGMQVNSPTERRIIFSVWDSGDEAVSRANVGTEDRVTLLAKGAGVDAGDFGNEGTGGHSHLVYHWKTGEKQRFLLTEKIADATHSVYAGYWFHPEQKKWLLISSWKAPKDGKYLGGLYSFVEDFGGDNGQLNRKALYGNQWYRTTDGRWHEQTVATFSHDSTGRADRLDRFMGVEGGSFFLSTGGFLPGATKYGTLFTRPSAGQVPADVGDLAAKLAASAPLQAAVRP
jgi:Domain of unknown function (DUF3472)/Domain of unknown function (DUF5077)